MSRWSARPCFRKMALSSMPGEFGLRRRDQAGQPDLIPKAMVIPGRSRARARCCRLGRVAFLRGAPWPIFRAKSGLRHG